jgi:hypothetical protein
LADGLGRRTGLKVCNTFREGLGTEGRDSVSEEGDFGDTENALGRVQRNSIILKLGEEDAELLVMLLGGSTKDKDVVYICKTEIQVFENLVHETERLGGVSQAKGHIGKFEKAERGGDGCLLDVVEVDGNLVECPYKVNFGEDGAAGKVVRVVLYVRDWVPVRDSASVESSVISTRSPTTVLLRH